jgi:hypothetical protein
MIPIDPGAKFGDLYINIYRCPTRQTEDEVMTLWELNDAERAAIANGARLGLRAITFGAAFQPVSLAVEGTSEWDALSE